MEVCMLDLNNAYAKANLTLFVIINRIFIAPKIPYHDIYTNYINGNFWIFREKLLYFMLNQQRIVNYYCMLLNNNVTPNMFCILLMVCHAYSTYIKWVQSFGPKIIYWCDIKHEIHIRFSGILNHCILLPAYYRIIWKCWWRYLFHFFFRSYVQFNNIRKGT